MSQTEPKTPDHAFNIGRINCAIWTEDVERDGRTFVDFNVKLEKRYRDKESDEYRSTVYFNHADLADLEDACREARRIMRFRDRSNGDHDE